MLNSCSNKIYHCEKRWASRSNLLSIVCTIVTYPKVYKIILNTGNVQVVPLNRKSNLQKQEIEEEQSQEEPEQDIPPSPTNFPLNTVWFMVCNIPASQLRSAADHGWPHILSQQNKAR